MSGEASRYPAPGEVIDGKYRIDRMLGEGGMGAVAGAFHVLRRAPVALKFISPDVVRVPGAVDRFVNEAVAASQIDSDHVVRIFDVGQLPSGLPYIVMEMMQGCDLSELLEKEGQGGFPVPRAVHFVLQILRALQVAHGAGIIHRDLKPSNAFVVTKDGEGDFVKLLDFGISKIQQDAGESQQRLTQTNTGLGTPLYMSPEQARNARDCTVRSDLYSVSAILYELLTGRTPYLAQTPNDLLFKLFTSEPDPLKGVRPDVPDGLAAVIHRGLAKEPEQRPQNAGEFAELLAPFADARSTSILSRIRAAAGGRASMASHTGERGSFAPAALERTMQAPPGSAALGAAVAKTAGSPAKTGGTQLEMASSETASAPPAKKGGSAKLVVGGVALAGVLAAVGFFVVRSTTRAPDPVSTSAEAPKTAEPPPSAAPAQKPEVAPVVPVVETASAKPEVAPPASASASAETKKRPPPAAPPSPPPATGKKNPFGVGIVQ